MQRDRIELQDIAALDNLSLALFKATKNKKQNAKAQAFLSHSQAKLNALSQRILNQQVPSGVASRFVVHDPKRREITAACLEDRVLHHAIMNLAQARLERSLLDSVYACGPGKGVHAAVAAVQKGLQRWAWAVQVDVANYFAQIDHAVLQNLLARRYKGGDFLALLARIMAVSDGQRSGRGLPIGSLMSQHWANAYLDSADRLLLQQNGVRAHVRYMDDIVWFCDTADAARSSLLALQNHMHEVLHLQLKPRVVLQPCRQGLQFCGFRVRAGLVLPSARKLKRARAGFKRLQAAQAKGVNVLHLQRAHACWQAALLPAQTRHFCQRLWGAHL